PPRPHVLLNLQLHQGLRQHLDPLPQHIHARVGLRLAQQLRQCHPHPVGHRRGPPRSKRVSTSTKTTRWPTASSCASLFTHVQGRYPPALRSSNLSAGQTTKDLELCAGVTID